MWLVVVRLLQACCLFLGAYLARHLPLILRCWLTWRQYKRFKVQGPPAGKTIFGHIDLLIGGKGPWKMAELTNQYGPIVKLQVLDKLVVLLTDPDTIGRLVRRAGPGPYLPKASEMYRPIEQAVIPSVPTMLTSEDGPYWKAVRQGAAPCFSASNLKKVLPVLLELSQRVADRAATVTAAAAAAREAPLFDVTDAAKRITSDIMGHLLLGEDLGGTHWKPSSSKYLDIFCRLLKGQGELVFNPWHYSQRFWNSEVADCYRSIRQHDAYMDEVVDRLLKDPPADYTIAAHLLAVKDPATGKPLTKQQLKGEIAVLMGAGFETTSHAITWCLAVLAAHQDIQQKVVDELTAAGLAPAGHPGVRDIDSSELGKLPYMSAVIKEVLRACPAAPWGGFKLTTDDVTEMCGYDIPKDTTVFITLMAVAMSQHNYGNSVLEVRPERWMSDSHSTISSTDIGGTHVVPEAAHPAPDPYSFLAGPRDCIGQNLAKMELQVVLATLLSRFRFLPGPQLEKELKAAAALGQPLLVGIHAMAEAHLTMQPADGTMMLKLEPRA